MAFVVPDFRHGVRSGSTTFAKLRLGNKQHAAEESAETMSRATDHKTLAKACLVPDPLPACTHRQQAMQNLMQTKT